MYYFVNKTNDTLLHFEVMKYILKYFNSWTVDNSMNDCNCRFQIEMETKRKNAGLQL